MADVRPAALAAAGGLRAGLRHVAHLLAQSARDGGPPHRARSRADGRVRRCAEPVQSLRRRFAHDAVAAAVGGALVRHRRPGSRHPVAPHLRLAHHAVRRRARGGPGRTHRARGGDGRRLFGRAHRRRIDADHRYLPRLPAVDPCPRIRRGARSRHRECGDRHRAHVVAPVCPDRARRDAHAPASRLHRGGALDRRLAVANRMAAHHAVVRVVSHRPRHARHGRHHHHRGGTWASSDSARSRRCPNGAR